MTKTSSTFVILCECEEAGVAEEDPSIWPLYSLGELLYRSIKVFWTGGKVVSSTVTAKEIKNLSEVIKRKPVLWDNLHANDYDHQRVFLGPYTGLVFLWIVSTEIKTKQNKTLSTI